MFPGGTLERTSWEQKPCSHDVPVENMVKTLWMSPCGTFTMFRDRTCCMAASCSARKYAENIHHFPRGDILCVRCHVPTMFLDGTFGYFLAFPLNMVCFCYVSRQISQSSEYTLNDLRENMRRTWCWFIVENACIHLSCFHHVFGSNMR